MKRLIVFHALILITALSLFGCKKRTDISYPPARKDSVVDVYHGVEVADPYRWLEDADSNETLFWVSEQNRITEGFLSTIDARKNIEQRLTELWDFPRYSTPGKKDSRYFFRKNDGLQNQSVLYMQKTLDSEPEVVLNPNLWSDDGTVAMTRATANPKGNLLAYGISKHGSDWQQVKIRDIDAEKDFSETLDYCRYASIAWKNDDTGFFYNRFPEPNTVSQADRYNYSQVWWHTLGTEQTKDKLIYHNPNDKELGFVPIATEDGKYLLLYIYHGTDPKNRIYYRQFDSTGPFVKLLDDNDARYDPIGNIGPVFYFHTDLDAPKGRIIAIDTDKPARENWKEIIPQTGDVIDYVTMVNDKLVVAWMHDVHHELKIYAAAGKELCQIPLPVLGTVAGINGRQKDTEMFFSFISFLFPPTIYRYDFTGDKFTIFRRPQIDFDPSPYDTKQVFFTSADGTRVPMFIVSKKDITLDGSNPFLLTAYGGFGSSNTPYFSVSLVTWLEMGGTFALANIRGGGEYGKEWHDAGKLLNKKNCFDDFIAAAIYLIENKYTSPEKLAIRGGSNGGTLVTACMLRRPELYGAVVAQVPVTDMLRYQKFTIGRYWIPEFGSAQTSKEMFEYLYSYSPLHNVKQGIEYPPILVTTADTDDRVVPSHAKKFVAELQAKAAGANHILLRVEIKAGHGVGKPTTKIIREITDVYTFLHKTLDMK